MALILLFFDKAWADRTVSGALVVLCTIMGLMATHPYPETPLFGVAPCPTTIFTLGLLLLASHPRPMLLAAVPILWAAIGGSAAVLINVPQDWGLLVAGLIWLAAWIRERTASGPRAAAQGHILLNNRL